MNQKKGFTLIELLAVIVILAVIALIAAPIIVGIINDAEKKAFEDTVYGIVYAGELRYGKEMLKDSDYNGETLFLDKDELEYSGAKVNGTVLIENDGKVTASIYDSKKRWCAIKSYDEEKASIGTYKEGKCNVANLYPSIRKWASNSTEDFHNEAYRTKIKTIEVIENNTVPTEALASFDVSENQDGSVMAYVTDAGEGMYHLFIGGNKRVSANSNSSYLFYNFTNVESINVDLLYTGNVTNMSSMFRNNSKLNTLDASHFDTSKVTSMENMFALCQNMTSLDVSHFNTSNVTVMSSMFYFCQKLTELDVSHFDTSKVTSMENMFALCQNVTNLDVSHFDTSKVANMKSMFYDCRKLTKLDVSHFDTSNVITMESMFASCWYLTTVDVSHFDTRNVTNMGSLFYSCSSLSEVDVRQFNTSRVTDMNNMFSGCSRLIKLDISSFNTGNVTNVKMMFSYLNSIQEINLGKFEYEKVTNTSFMFKGLANNVKIITKDVDTQNLVLGLTGDDRPSSWSTSNVIIG